MREALEQARQARLFILERMATALTAPRGDLAPHAPRIHTLQIPVDKIRQLIGPGGKMIRSIVDETGVKIDVEDDGTVKIFSTTGTAAAGGHSAHHRHLRGGRDRQDLVGHHPDPRRRSS